MSKSVWKVRSTFSAFSVVTAATAIVYNYVKKKIKDMKETMNEKKLDLDDLANAIDFLDKTWQQMRNDREDQFGFRRLLLLCTTD